MQTFYTVRPGESLFVIAQRWFLSMSSLIAANQLKPPYTLSPGQQLSMPPGINTHRVKSGESVSILATQYGIPVAVIIEANQLKSPYTLQVDQSLIIPEGVPYYVVQTGDTLSNLAQKYNVTTDGKSNPDLIQGINNLPSPNLTLGMKLIIPYAPPGGTGFIAYISNQAGSYDLWLYNPQNGDRFSLTNQLGDEFSQPFWSPDSKKIAFIGKNGIINVYHLATGNTAKVDQIEPYTPLSWSPTRQILGYKKQDHIVLYDTVQYTFQTLSLPGVDAIQWFPNGKDILFAGPDSTGTQQLYRMRIGGTKKVQLTHNTNGAFHELQISPDGSFATYTSPGASISLIYTIDLSSGKIYSIQGGPLGKNYHPTWSPNSSFISYSATIFPTNMYYSYIQTDNPFGTQSMAWAISDCFSSTVSWAPDGTKIAYLSGCKSLEQSTQIWAVDTKNPAPRLVIKGSQIPSLQWSPRANVAFPQKIYTSSLYKVTLTYPANWQEISEDHFAGRDGFFQVSALSATDNNLQDVCQGEAFHVLKPYGSTPRIIKSKIQKQEASYIYPSSDQPPEMKKQAALIVRYPQPVKIGEETYFFFILWADQNHIKDLGAGLRF